MLSISGGSGLRSAAHGDLCYQYQVVVFSTLIASNSVNVHPSVRGIHRGRSIGSVGANVFDFLVEDCLKAFGSAVKAVVAGSLLSPSSLFTDDHRSRGLFFCDATLLDQYCSVCLHISFA